MWEVRVSEHNDDVYSFSLIQWKCSLFKFIALWHIHFIIGKDAQNREKLPTPILLC
jgi:hypothetical protein